MTCLARACRTSHRWTSSRRARFGRSSSASARTARSARTRTRSRSCGARGGLNAQGYFVYDSKKSGSQTVSHLRFGPRPDPRPLPGRTGQLRRLPPVRAARPGRRARPRRPGRDAAAELRRAARAGLGRAAAAGAGEDHRQAASTLYAIDAGQIAREAGLAGRTNTVLQTCFFAHVRACCRATRRSPRSSPRSPRPTAAAARTWSGAMTQAVDQALAGLHQIEVPGLVTSGAGAAACRARRRAGVRPHGHRRDDGRPRRRTAGQRRCRRTAPTRAAPRPTRSATSPTWSPSGTRTCASSAATAVSSARTA